MSKNNPTLSVTLPTHQLLARGQSPWLDDISDQLIASGELKVLIEEKGIRGVTSNPTIFEKAINSAQGRYPGQLRQLRESGATAIDAYERLTLEDIQATADLLYPVYRETDGNDGFVSLEVLPAYAYDEEKSVQEARRLFETLGRPNIMIKVPGTREGIRAFRRLTTAGVNINVTLIFSRRFYQDIAHAYIQGLKDRLIQGEDITRVRSVASVFVSRIDTAVDKKLEQMRPTQTDPAGKQLIQDLLHTIGIANVRLIYHDFQSIFSGDSFSELTSLGAAAQRPLWGSTSTKNSKLRDVLYVEELVASQTVNTLPRKTLDAFLDHGHVRGSTLENEVDEARQRIESLSRLGINLEEVCADLQKAGVQSFADSFEKLFASLEAALS